MQAEREQGAEGAASVGSAATTAPPPSGGRTSADVSTLLLELGRAHKGWSFYPSDHPARAELLDRAWRAWQGDLRRHGPLVLEIRRAAFWLPGVEAPVAAHGDDVARQLAARGVSRIAFDADLDAATLAGLLDALVADADALRAEGGFEPAFYGSGSRRGIGIDETDWRARLQPVSAAPAAGLENDDLGDFATDEVPATLAGGDADELELELETDPDPAASGDLDPLLPVAFGTPIAGEDAEHTQPVAPLDPEAARARELESLLSQLEDCEDDLAYRDLARDVATLGQRLVEAGDDEGVFRILVLLSHHASDDAKRSFAQRESADGFLAQLARGDALRILIDRAVDGSVESSLEATAALRGLGARVAGSVLDRLEQETEPERRGRLSGVLIAMGDEAAPALLEALVHGSKRRMRVAIRLAGETQNPRLVACLREILLSGESEVSREAARALVRVGDVSSLEVLAEALHSLRPEVAAIAAFALGATGRALAVPPLQEALGRALDQNDHDLAREVVRGLGRLGRPEAAPVVAGVLERGGFFGRRRLREVQLAAIAALAQLPGPEAEAALARTARSRDAKLRAAAAAALRRGPGGAGGGKSAPPA